MQAHILHQKHTVREELMMLPSAVTCIAQMMEDVSVSQPWLVSSEASALPLPPVAIAVQVYTTHITVHCFCIANCQSRRSAHMPATSCNTSSLTAIVLELAIVECVAVARELHQ
jgi:hypothetical protein